MEDSIFSAVLLPLALAVIMLSLGMSLTPEDFKRVFVKPRGVSIGLLNLVLLSPLLAFAIAHAFSLEPAFAVGLVLLGASPGGILANLLTHFARAVYASFMFIPAGLFAWLMYGRNRAFPSGAEYPQ
jgi:BASS family bile acid:Na+ symporter